MIAAYVGLGANLGDRHETLASAIARLDALEATRVEARSSLYESDPVGLLDQPPFLNAAVRLATRLEATALLRRLLAIEADLGRVRGVRFGPRTCDLDLLLYGRSTIETPDLQVPHPRLTERRFVLLPLLDLDPELHLPDGRALADLAPLVADQVVRPIDSSSLR